MVKTPSNTIHQVSKFKKCVKFSIDVIKNLNSWRRQKKIKIFTRMTPIITTSIKSKDRFKIPTPQKEIKIPKDTTKGTTQHEE
jgi:hypothetical protein